MRVLADTSANEFTRDDEANSRPCAAKQHRPYLSQPADGIADESNRAFRLRKVDWISLSSATELSAASIAGVPFSCQPVETENWGALSASNIRSMGRLNECRYHKVRHWKIPGLATVFGGTWREQAAGFARSAINDIRGQYRSTRIATWNFISPGRMDGAVIDAMPLEPSRNGDASDCRASRQRRSRNPLASSHDTKQVL